MSASGAPCLLWPGKGPGQTGLGSKRCCLSPQRCVPGDGLCEEAKLPKNRVVSSPGVGRAPHP